MDMQVKRRPNAMQAQIKLAIIICAIAAIAGIVSECSGYVAY
jgi:hypothetical protein